MHGSDSRSGGRAATLLAVLACVSGVVRNACAQEPAVAVLSGRVSDALTRSPLPGAVVSLEGTSLLTTTDQEGRYRIRGVPAGPQVVRVASIGYAPLRKAVSIASTASLVLDLELAKSALNLPGLVVTADPSSRARGELGTASVIEREAIRSQTAASLAGVLELVPGTVLQPPGLDGVQQFALRAVPIGGGGGTATANAIGPSASALASFGTQIVLDGVPISNNVNLQTTGSRAELFFATASGGGIDLRRIPAATLERVEVIRGIPSARFGDLTQGVVLVDTRAGAVDPELQVRLDARTVEATIIGGHKLGQFGAGTANLNLTRTRTHPGFRDNTGSRISAQLAHRYQSGFITADTRADFYQVLEDEPELALAPGVASRSRDAGLRLSERARWKTGARTRLEWTAALEGDRQRSFSQAQLLRGAMPFTDRLTEGRQDGRFVGGLYLARIDVQGDPRQVYSRLEFTAETRRLGFEHTLRIGNELRREWNGGPGVLFDIEFPPQVSFNGVEGFDRPRRFDSIPPLLTSAFYLDDRLSRSLGGPWLLNLQAGIRLDLLHEGSWWISGLRDQVLQPRLQAELAPNDRVRFRAGGGRVAKVASLADLFPAPQYYDLVNFNYFANDPAERRAIITTRILDRANPDLGMSRADKAEAGFELDLGRGAQLAVNAYADRVRRAVGIDASMTFLIRERFAVDSSTIGTGRPPDVIEPAFARDTIPTLVDRPANNLRLQSRGIELTAILPELEPLRTTLAFSGAWTRSRLESSSVELASRFDDFQLNDRQQRAPYWLGTVRTGERILLTTRIIHHQPQAGLVITGTLQTHLREVLVNEASTDTLAFAGYVTRSGQLVPVPRERRGDPEFADIRQSRSGLLTDLQKGPVDWLFSLQVSKSLPLEGRLSFYAFNLFDRIGSHGGRTTTARLFSPLRFGIELTAPLGLAWGER
jgi:hypothetical protein